MERISKIKQKNCFVLLVTLVCIRISAQSSQRPVVTDITAHQISSNKIEISWKLPVNTNNTYISSLLLYKDIKPLTDINRLDSLNAIELPRGTISYLDLVSDLREYYYAVIAISQIGNGQEELYFDEEKDKTEIPLQGTPYIVLLPGVNSTVDGSRISTYKTNALENKNYDSVFVPVEDTESRPQPLPYMDILRDEDNKTSTISKSTTKQALTLIRNTSKKTIILEPYVFEEDIVSPQGGDDYLLFEVLSTSFIQQNYSSAITKLQEFMSHNRNKDSIARATFYLGESYYYCGNYPMALTLFLSLEDIYPNLVKKWSESSLDLYKLPDAD